MVLQGCANYLILVPTVPPSNGLGRQTAACYAEPTKIVHTARLARNPNASSTHGLGQAPQENSSTLTPDPRPTPLALSPACDAPNIEDAWSPS